MKDFKISQTVIHIFLFNQSVIDKSVPSILSAFLLMRLLDRSFDTNSNIAICASHEYYRFLK